MKYTEGKNDPGLNKFRQIADHLKEDQHMFDPEWNSEHECQSCKGTGVEDEWALHPAPCQKCWGEGTI